MVQSDMLLPGPARGWHVPGQMRDRGGAPTAAGQPPNRALASIGVDIPVQV